MTKTAKMLDIPLPVEVVVDVAPASSLRVRLTLGTMLMRIRVVDNAARPVETHLERLMTIADVLKPVDLRLVGKEGGAYRMDRSIAPSLIVEAPLLVQVVEEFRVRCCTPEVEVSNFKVRPDCRSQLRRGSSLLD